MPPPSGGGIILARGGGSRRKRRSFSTRNGKTTVSSEAAKEPVFVFRILPLDDIFVSRRFVLSFFNVLFFFNDIATTKR
jgi:hypothetical protein